MPFKVTDVGTNLKTVPNSTSY